MDKALLFAYAETPVHHGGSESVGVIDLPVQREAASRLPTIWGQSAKGALRQHARANPGWPDVTKVFGSEPPGSSGGDDQMLTAGWLAVGDFRLLAFPVPTLDHVFAWATSPLLLARLGRQANLAGIRGLPAIPEVKPGTALADLQRWGGTGRVAIADYDLPIGVGLAEAAAWATWLADNAMPAAGDAGGDAFEVFREKLRKDLIIVDDDQMQALGTECAEVVARVQLDPDKKTVKNLWYTEYLPAETLMVSLLRSTGPDLGQLKGALDGELLVAGGDESVGKGLMWLRWLDANGAPIGAAGPNPGAGHGAT